MKEGGTDSYFGLVDGNGGEWFELVVVEDVDMRNWSLRWINAESTDYEGTITLSDHTFWSDVRAGTIITFIEDGTANGGKDTDKEINHTDDWWVNICTEEQQEKYLKNKNWLARVEPQDQTGEIKVNSENWILYIYDAQGRLEFGPGGEGEYVANGKGKVGSGEVFYLCEDPGSQTVPHSRYLDGCTSTFGSPNVGSLGDEGLPEFRVQDFSAFWGAPCNCEQVLEMGFSLAGDLNNDCRVDFNDFAVFAPHWLACIDPENPDSDWPWTEQQDQRTPLIVNEFNCVSRDNYLDSEIYSDEGKTKGLEADSYFASVNPEAQDGRIQGNGGNWIELVVTQDHLDVRGWRILMVATNTDKAPNANGTDLWYGDAQFEQSVITFNPTATSLSDLRAGTILTVGEAMRIGLDTDDYGLFDRNFTTVPESEFDIYLDLHTDVSFDPFVDDPSQRDWWMHISSVEEVENGAAALVTTQTNITDSEPGHFSVSDGSLEITIVNHGDEVVFGPIGEDVPGWGGSGVNAREVGCLTTYPTGDTSLDGYSDNVYSSFGRPNRWGSDGQEVQNLGQIRSWLYPPMNCQEARAMGYILEMDVNEDCVVDLADLLLLFEEQWFNCIVPGDATCSEPWNP